MRNESCKGSSLPSPAVLRPEYRAALLTFTGCPCHPLDPPPKQPLFSARHLAIAVV
jgi:hypothetical protein